MLEYSIIQVEKTLTSTSGNIVLQKYDNNISKLNFSLDENLINYAYAFFKNVYSNKSVFIELDADNSVTLNTSITKTAGTWELLLVSTNGEITDGNFDESSAIYVTKAHRFIYVKDNYLTDSIEVIQATTANTSHISTNGKNFLFLGDSITANPNGYISHVADILGVATTNMAVNGATWRDEIGFTNTISNQLKSVIENMQDYEPDSIVISAGANDSISTTYTTDALYTEMESFYTSSGSVLDINAIDRKNIFGATRYAIETFKKLYPNANIFLLSPIQSALAIKDYKVAYATGFILQEVAKRLSVNYIDCINCGISSANASETLVDGLHPNELGAKLQGQHVANKILDFYNSQRVNVFSDDIKGLITLDSSSISATVGSATQIKAVVYPFTAENKTVAWTTSNASIATVVNGYIVGAGIGNCTITATAEADNSATLEFSVTIAEEVDNGLIFEANEMGVADGIWLDNVSALQASSENPVTANNGVVIDGKFDFNIASLGLGNMTDFAVVVDAYIPDTVTADSLLFGVGSDTIHSGDENDNIFFVVNAWDYDIAYGRIVSNWTYSDQKNINYTVNSSNKIILNVSITDNVVTMYVNGVAETNTIAHIINTEYLTALSNVVGGNIPFSGKYNSIQIYDHLLTNEEITTITST